MTRSAVLRPMTALLAVACIGTHAARAQKPAPATAADSRLSVVAGRSTVLTTEFDVTRIAVTDPAIADAVVVNPREVLVDGKRAGAVSLFIWGNGRREHHEVVVQAAPGGLQQQLQTLFPGERISAVVTEEAVLLSGEVSNSVTILRASEVAAVLAPKARIVNLLQLAGAVGSQQVLLQVRVAEVNRRALTELGASFFASDFKNYKGRITTQQFAAPDFDEDRLTFSDFLNIFLFNTEHGVGALVRALKTSGFFQTLAEPNLIAYNGQEASFLAGGEIPVPIVQSTAGLAAISVLYKEFGVRLSFRPTIAGDLIRLRVRPEVSSLDFTNGVTLQGFRIPALTTRRAETEVELRDGQSFAIAGLIDNLAQDTQSRIPGLGDLPVIGVFFRSRAKRAERTELLVLVTPRLVRPLDPADVPRLPIDPLRFLPGTTMGSPDPPAPPAVTAVAPAIETPRSTGSKKRNQAPSRGRARSERNGGGAPPFKKGGR